MIPSLAYYQAGSGLGLLGTGGIGWLTQFRNGLRQRSRLLGWLLAPASPGDGRHSSFKSHRLVYLGDLEGASKVHMNVLEGSMYDCLVSVLQVIHSGLALLTGDAGQAEGCHILFHVGPEGLFGQASVSVLDARVTQKIMIHSDHSPSIPNRWRRSPDRTPLLE